MMPAQRKRAPEKEPKADSKAEESAIGRTLVTLRISASRLKFFVSRS